MRRVDAISAKGLRQFVDAGQQHRWLEGEAGLPDAAERTESLEQRFKYTARFEKPLQRPQARDILEILGIYGQTCIPIPRTTERFYWSVSCLPSSPDRPLVRVNAAWMELFALHPDACPEPGRRSEDVRARIILHLSDFTTDGSPDPDEVDIDLLESLAEQPEQVSHTVWRNDKGIIIVKVRGAASIRAFLADPHGLRAIRRFNLTHMNRGRNAYQASHCHSLADVMVEG
jgi:hypothetical protein